MPEGQFTGSRSNYEYTSDGGVVYKLKLDDTLGSLADAGLTPAGPTSTAVNKPLNFKPRVVFWQGVLDGLLRRKELVCNPTSALYQTVTGQALTVDGVDGITTGRRGEKLTF